MKFTKLNFFSKLKNRNVVIVIFIVVFAVLGATLIPNLIAADAPVVYEVEQGTLGGNARLVSDNTASGGSAVAFGSETVTPPPPAPAPAPSPTPTPPPSGAGTYPIKASSNGKYLQTADNKYYYYLADTAWWAPAKMNQADFIALLDNRKAKGFNTIQVSALMFTSFNPVANAYGDKPFAGGDYNLSNPLEVGARTSSASSPDYDYWDHLEYLIDEAAKRDMQINIVASWYGYGGRDWRTYVNNTNASAYGEFLGKRFGNKKNIMWTLGGDNDPDASPEAVTRSTDKTSKIQASINMGNAIKNNESIPHLMSYHAVRRSSSNDFFYNQSWHTVSYSYTDTLAYPLVQKDYDKSLPKPVINPETYYDKRETINANTAAVPLHTLRAQAYFTYLSGGVGYAYGNERIWDVDTDWKARMNDASASDMTRAINLLNKYKFELLPDHRAGNSNKMLSSGYGTNGSLTYAVSARSRDNSVGLTYFPSSRGSIVVNLSAFNGGNIKLSWFNPANGNTTVIGTYPGSGTRGVTFPSGQPDSVLIAEKQ